MIRIKTLFEIVEEVKDGGKPSYEELKYALLVYAALYGMEHRELLKVLRENKPMHKIVAKSKADNFFSSFKNALNTSPKKYLGWKYDPENPEYQKLRKVGIKVLDKVVKNIEDREGK